MFHFFKLQLNAANRNLYSIKTTLNLVKNHTEMAVIRGNSQYIIGPKLHNWVDNVAGQSWSVKDVCFLNSFTEQWTHLKPDNCNNDRTIDSMIPSICKHLSWSTFSPDPKSELGIIKSNGRIR